MDPEKCTFGGYVEFMSENQFGKLSRLLIRAAEKEGKTVPEDVYFTAPFKLMRPFPLENGGLRYMQMAASAGIMEGDRQQMEFEVKKGAFLEFISQAYEKIHEMKSGCAGRQTKVTVHSGGSFYFHPQPTIPFKDSAFENHMEIYLEDDSAQFRMSEILSCGRYARGERFAYRSYLNLVEIYRGGKMIYRDNTRYDPALFNMEGIGMYESYTHLSNIFISRPADPENFKEKIKDILEKALDPAYGGKITEHPFEGGVTLLPGKDLAVRILGRRAQDLEMLNEKIMALPDTIRKDV